MPVDAVAMVLSSATVTAPNGRVALSLDIDNTSGTEAAVITDVRLYATAVGVTHRTPPVAFGVPARTLASAAQGGSATPPLLCSVIPFAPQRSGSQEISIGADVTFSTGQVVVATPATLTVSAPSH